MLDSDSKIRIRNNNYDDDDNDPLIKINTSNKYNSTTTHKSSIYNRLLRRLYKYIPLHMQIYLNKSYIVYPVILSLLIIISSIIGYIIFKMIDAGYFDPDVSGALMVVYSMDDTPFTAIQGAFSDFQAGVGAIFYGMDHNAAAVQLYYNNRLYVDNEHGDNYWNYFWKSDTFILDNKYNDKKFSKTVYFDGWLARYGKLGSFTRDVIGHKRVKSIPYPMQPYRSIAEVSYVVNKYIQPHDWIVDDINSFINQHWPSNAFIIGVHYRGTDKVDAYPYKHPSFSVFDYYVQQVNSVYNGDNKPIHIFIATDSSDFIDWAILLYGSDRISYIVDSPRLSGNDVEALKSGTHKNNKFSNYQKGLSSVLDCLLLSRTNYLIKNRSGLSDVSIWFAGPDKLKFTMILGENDPVYHLENNKLLQPPKELWSIDNYVYLEQHKK